MLSGDLAAIVSESLQIKTGTVLDRAKLSRAAGLQSRRGHGPRSGARMTPTDCVNATLANVLECPPGGRAGAVRAVRVLPLEEAPLSLPADLTRGLTCFGTSTAGEALDAFLDDLRTGRVASWAAGEPWNMRVSLEARGQRVFMSIIKGRPEFARRAIQSFALPGYDAARNQVIERQVTLGEPLFMRLAAALGPPG